MQEGDILVVEGKFTSQDGKTILNMGTSYISVGTNTADFSTTMPEPAPEPTIVNAGAMQADSRGKSSEGLYFKLSANDAPFNPDWTESYTPASADCIKLIRDGKTYSIGNIAAGTIIKYSETEYYLKTEKWMMSDVYPIRDGDILLVEGNFLDAKGETALSFSSNYISMEYGSATFSETYPDGSAFNKVETGMMGEDSWKDVTNGVSFTLADNQAPGNPDWSLMYTPATESCIQLVRDGVTYNVAIPGRGTIVKFDDNRYYIKADNWAMGEYAPLREDDVLIVSGDFVNSENGYVLSIPTNYIGIYWERPYFYDTMPTEKRGSIGEVKPTGWINAKYDFVDGKYLYNRCHLIGYQLTSENANEKNLITGTRYLNVQGMLPFENMTADYVKETENHVLYRVTPVFEGNNLVAAGVLMEAESVEDKGEGVEFCVFVDNAQPGVTIDYATGDSWLDENGTGNQQAAAKETKTVVETEIQAEKQTQAENTQAPAKETSTYILNTNSKKFHKPGCSAASQIKAANKDEFTGTRDEVIAKGYEPCKKCNP